MSSLRRAFLRFNDWLRMRVLKFVNWLQEGAYRRYSEQIQWVFVDRCDMDYDDIVANIREMIEIGREVGDETAFIKAANGYFAVTGVGNVVIIPHSVIAAPEVVVLTRVVEGDPLSDPTACLLTGRDLLLLREKLDTVRRIVLIAVGEEGEVIKAFTIREEERERLRRRLEEIVEDGDECLRFRYSAFSDEALRRFFDITVYESVEEMVRDVFPAASSRRFEQVIQYVKSRYDPRLLDEHADEIGRAIKDILESAIRERTPCAE